MKANSIRWALLFVFTGIILAQQSTSLPRLARNHGATQIIVDGKPLLVRGAELENSSASSLSYMETVWPKLFIGDSSSRSRASSTSPSSTD